MKIKHVLGSTLLAGIAALGLSAGLKDGQVTKVRADTFEGTVHVTFEGITKWSTDNDKFAIYFWNGKGNEDPEKKDGWSGLYSFTEELSYEVAYSLEFKPVKMILSRQNATAETAAWGTSHNQSGDLNYSEYIWATDEWTPGVVSAVEVRSNKVTDFGRKQYLLTKGLNGESHIEFSGSVTLEENEEFKMLYDGTNKWSGFYGCPARLDSCFSGGSKESVSDDNPNIKCLVAGTYSFFYDIEINKLWISRQDIVDADGYATYFLEHIGCDATGVNEPTGWEDVGGKFATLTNDAKKYLCLAEGSIEEGADNIAKCVFWYDRALKQHSGLVGFMSYNDGTKDVVRTVSNNFQQGTMVQAGSTYAIIIIVSTLIVSVAGVIIISKRKHD